MKVTWIILSIISLGFSELVLAAHKKPECPSEIKFGPGIRGCHHTEREIWSYDNETDKCYNWVYAGCKEILENGYSSEKVCHDGCVKSGIDNVQLKHYNCLQTTHPQPKDPKRVCPSKTVWSYNVTANKCTKWSFNGCARGGNIFDTYADCQHKCLQYTFFRPRWFDAKDDCLGVIEVLARENCQSYPRGSFQQLVSICKPRYWGSCKLKNHTIHNNRAIMFALCYNKCYTHEEWLLPKYWEATCKLPMQPRPKKTICVNGHWVWSYVRAFDACVKWKYFGCEILGNYYKTERDCKRGCSRELGVTLDWGWDLE